MNTQINKWYGMSVKISLLDKLLSLFTFLNQKLTSSINLLQEKQKEEKEKNMQEHILYLKQQMQNLREQYLVAESELKSLGECADDGLQAVDITPDTHFEVEETSDVPPIVNETIEIPYIDEEAPDAPSEVMDVSMRNAVLEGKEQEESPCEKPVSVIHTPTNQVDDYEQNLKECLPCIETLLVKERKSKMIICTSLPELVNKSKHSST